MPFGGRDSAENMNEERPHRFRPPYDFDDDYEDDDDDEYEFTGTPYNQKLNATQLFHHHGGKHGEHHGKHGEHHGKHGGPEMSKEHHQRAKRVDPYREWLDYLPTISKDTAKLQAR